MELENLTLIEVNQASKDKYVEIGKLEICHWGEFTERKEWNRGWMKTGYGEYFMQEGPGMEWSDGDR